MKTFYTAELPIKTCSEANAREHWAVKAKRTQSQRMEAYYECRAKFGLLSIPPNATIEVHLSRLGKRMLDSDNLASAFKAIRDGIADYLKIDDGDPRISWHYEQALCKTNGAMLVIIIEC